MHFTTRTKITFLFTVIFLLCITTLNIILFESANREWQIRQHDYVEEVMQAMYTPEEAKEKFEHLKIMGTGGELVHAQWAYSGDTMLEKAGSFLFADRDIYEKNGKLYFSVREVKDGFTLDMAEEVTSIIQTRDLIVDRSLSVSFFGTLAVIVIGYLFSGYILSPIRTMHHVAENFSLRKKKTEHHTGIVGHAQDEVVMLARSLESLFSRVRSEWEKLEQFSDDIAHEIKNTLFSIQSSLDIALHTEHRDVGIAKARKLLIELSWVVDALLFFSRNETGTMVDTLLYELIESHTDLTDTRIHITGSRSVSCPIYPELWMTAVGNIISNAQKFTEADGTITIDITEEYITITDTWTGIWESDLPHIFDRLYKADTVRSHGTGYGLGLAIAKKIIEELHHQTLSVESKKWVGTKFVISCKK